MKNLFILLICACSSLHGQATFDIRKANWGMTVEEVKKSELPKTPSKDEPSTNPKDNTYYLQYDNVIINDVKTTLSFAFENGKLKSLNYTFWSTWQGSGLDFPSKVKYTSFIFSSLIKEKKMKPSSCWKYDFDKSYSDFAAYTCDYTSDVVLKDIEQKGLSNKQRLAQYHMYGQRSSAWLRYYLVDYEESKDVLGNVTISAYGEGESAVKDSGF